MFRRRKVLINVEETLQKIRSGYQRFIKEYSKPETIKLSFEERYIDVVRRKGRLDIFLLHELKFLQQLERKERVKREKEERYQESKGTVDSIYKEQQKLIKKYPPLETRNPLPDEIARLLGAIKQLEDEYGTIIRDLLKHISHEARNQFDVRLYKLVSIDEFELPPIIVERQRAFTFASSKTNVTKASQYIIKECSFFLHDLAEVLSKILRTLPQQEEAASVLVTHIDAIIKDFRLMYIRKS